MSLNANPLMYLNLGGEMLHVLRQRLIAQRIRSEKATKVLDDVIIELLNPKFLTIVIQQSQIFNISWLRSTMESIALCSIMKLDNESMNKLFDLMTMMVKYQLTAATGPREIVLITLNHIDSFREIISSTIAHQCVTLVHEMVVGFYSELTYNEIWQARNECLKELNSVNVRVSILLKLGIQNEDTTFNITTNNYDEKFIERQSELGDVKLSENTCRGCNVGSFQFFGDRVTILGKNIYSPNYNNMIKAVKHVTKNREQSSNDSGMKAELGMLAMQLGTDEETSIISRPFSLDLFIEDTKIDSITNDISNINEKLTELKNEKFENSKTQSNEDYREKLNNVCADFIENDVVERKMNLLDLLDEAE